MIELNDSNFDAEIKRGLVLVDFWAPWCGPCRAQAPVLEKLDKSKVKVCKVNTDENASLSQRFNIMNIPTLMVFKDGKNINTSVGLHNSDRLNKLLGL